MNILRGGRMLHARIHASHPSRPWLVMLHGFMQESGAFSSLLASLSRFANPITLDVAGHGHSDPCPDPNRHTADQLVEDVLAWVTRLQLGPFLLYGYSMGGRLALQVLQTVCERQKASPEEHSGLAGLIVESAHPGWFSPQEREQRRRKELSWVEALNTDPFGFIASWNENPLFGPAEDRAGQKELQDADSARGPLSIFTSADPARASSYAASLQGFGTSAMPEIQPESFRLAETAGIPLLFIAGGWDEPYRRLAQRMHEATSGATSDATSGARSGAPTGARSGTTTGATAGTASGAPSSRLEIVPDAWHRVHLDQPERWLQAIHRFTESNPHTP